VLVTPSTLCALGVQLVSRIWPREQPLSPHHEQTLARHSSADANLRHVTASPGESSIDGLFAFGRRLGLNFRPDSQTSCNGNPARCAVELLERARGLPEQQWACGELDSEDSAISSSSSAGGWMCSLWNLRRGSAGQFRQRNRLLWAGRVSCLIQSCVSGKLDLRTRLQLLKALESAAPGVLADFPLGWPPASWLKVGVQRGVHASGCSLHP